MFRHPLPLVLTSLLAAPGAAQDPPAPPVRTPADLQAPPELGKIAIAHAPELAAEAAFSLWVSYHGDAHAFADHSRYLADLQQRFAEHGIRIAVVLPAEAAAAAAAGKPAFAVGRGPGRPAVEELRMLLGGDVTQRPDVRSVLCRRGEAVAQWNALDGVVDFLEAAAAGTFDPQKAGEIVDLVPSVLFGIGDGGDFSMQVRHSVETWPTSGRALALPVLEACWCTGDLEAARAAARAGIRRLADEAVPLCVFADIVLRGMQDEPEIAKLLAVSLAPAAAAAPEGAFTQLVYLRALLRAGQDRIAGRLAATLPALLADRPLEQLIFAETLMEAGTPAVHRDAADRALEAAAAGGVEPKWLAGARHKVLVRTGAPAAEIDKLLAEHRQSDAFQQGLNNEAWYLMVQEPTMGRFDTLALAHCEEMLRQEGDSITPGNKDTVALAMFRNGRLEKAVELQTEAAEASGNNPEYVGRLERFRQGLLRARQRQQDARGPAKNPK